MPLFHIALASDWEAAQRTGRYTTSTRGRTLREVGYIHAAHADQWQQVHRRVYAEETEPLVLLTIDPARLDAPVREESVGSAAETFPHIYGAIDVDAVVRVLPLDPEPTGRAPQTFMQLFVQEMAFRAGLGLGVLVVAGTLGFAAQQWYGDTVALVVTVLALAGAALVARGISRRRDQRISTSSPPAR